jgi:signal transduction histidine kinase
MATSPQPDFDAAMRVLSKLRAAAPPVAARRLDEVMRVLQQLQSENAYLATRLADLARTPPTGEEAVGQGTSTAGFDFDAHLRALIEARQPALGAADPSALSTALAELTDEERTALVEYLKDSPHSDSPYLEPEDGFHERAAAADTGILQDIPDDSILLTRASDLLRPALISLRGQAESLIAGKAGRLPENAQASLNRIQESADGALALIDSLDMMRALRENTFEIRYSSFAPGALVRAAAAQFERRAAQHDNIMTLVVDEGLPDVYADFAASLVILSDLIDNALRYTPLGGATRISAEPIGTHILFTVADTGIGLTEDDSFRIGQAFWRALHQPLVRQHAGTGLRLFLARKVLERMGGELFLSGDPGLGSSFSFTLPIAI